MNFISELTYMVSLLLLGCISGLFILLCIGSFVDCISRQMFRRAFRRRLGLRRKVARRKWIMVHVWDYVLITSQIRLPKSKGPLFRDTHSGPSPERDVTCPICLQEMRPGQGLFIHLSCKNSWHQKCLKTWLKGTKLRDSTCLACDGPGVDSWRAGVKTAGKVTWYPVAMDVVQARHAALGFAWAAVSILSLLIFGLRLHPFTIIALYYCRRSALAWAYLVNIARSPGPRFRSPKEVLSLALDLLNTASGICFFTHFWFHVGASTALLYVLAFFLTLWEGYLMGKCIAVEVGALVHYW